MSSVFKIYSPEDCNFYYDGELQGHIEGNSKKAFRFEVDKFIKHHGNKNRTPIHHGPVHSMGTVQKQTDR